MTQLKSQYILIEIEQENGNEVSEYVGSHIFEALDFPVQETYLGIYKGEQVVACKDFNESGIQFVPFNDVGESSLEQNKEKYQYDYEDIMQMLRDNTKLTNVEETISMFWQIYIVDALLGNFDRHGANWGFLKKDNKYSIAPIFDNGSCLYPNLTDPEELQMIIQSEKETNKRIFTFPTSQIKLDGKKSSYYEVIHSLEFPECNEALTYMYSKIQIPVLEKIIDDTPMISSTQKEFYKHMLKGRYYNIIYESYIRLQNMKL